MKRSSISSPLSAASLAAILAFGAVSAQAVTILTPGATWEYTFTNPTANAAWNTSTGGWTTGPAPFGNVSGAGINGVTDFNYQTFWGADGSDGDDLWVRVGVDLTGFDLSTISYGLGVDNGYKLYVNGSLIASGNAEGYTFRWEYSSAIASGLLNPGVNVFAVALEDHGVATAFDMQILGDRLATVPDGGTTLLLLGMATVGLSLVRGSKLGAPRR